MAPAPAVYYDCAPSRTARSAARCTRIGDRPTRRHIERRMPRRRYPSTPSTPSTASIPTLLDFVTDQSTGYDDAEVSVDDAGIPAVDVFVSAAVVQAAGIDLLHEDVSGSRLRSRDARRRDVRRSRPPRCARPPAPAAPPRRRSSVPTAARRPRWSRRTASRASSSQRRRHHDHGAGTTPAKPMMSPSDAANVIRRPPTPVEAEARPAVFVDPRGRSPRSSSRRCTTTVRTITEL